MPSPVALFVFNRIEHTRRVVEALRANPQARHTDLYVFSDGARNDDEGPRVEAVRQYCSEIEGFKDVIITNSSTNLGLAKSIIGGVSKIVAEHGEVIVIEDDIVVTPRFLEFMNWGIKVYSSNSKVISVSGYSYPLEQELTENYFLRITSSWGWATWTSAWTKFNPDAEYLIAQIKARGLRKYFNFNNSFKYTRMLQDFVDGRNNSWAIRWYASAVLNQMLTLYPAKSMVENIGFDGTGTHCNVSNRFAGPVQQNFCNLNIVEARESELAATAMAQYFIASRPKLGFRIQSKIRRIIQNALSVSAI